MLDNIVSGLVSAITFQNICMVIIGSALGIFFGALPGFTATMGVAVLLPLTFGMPPETGLILLGSIFYGAMYGGSISAILLNTPGTPSAAATGIEGYPLTKKGRAGEALREAATASFLGGLFSVTCLLLIAPPLSQISLKFGPPEFFLLAVFGLTIIISVSGQSLVKGIISGVLGMIVGTVGMDPLLAYPRFTFGFSNLVEGIPLIPALIGLFSISEVLNLVKLKDQKRNIATSKKIQVGFPSLKHIKELIRTYLRSSIIGVFIGMLPGAGGSIASFLAYNEAKRASKHPDKFGTGIVEGLAACETANNAMAGGALIPMLTLGIPGDAVSAIMMGGLLIHGLNPGPELFSGSTSIVAYTFIIGLYLANIAFFLFGICASPYFARITNIPANILAAIVVVFAVTGSYAVSNRMFDVWIMLFFGFLGYFLRIYGFNVIPIVLGIILAPIAERGLAQSVAISGGGIMNLLAYFVHRPISLVLIILIIISLAISIRQVCREGQSMVL